MIVNAAIQVVPLADIDKALPVIDRAIAIIQQVLEIEPDNIEALKIHGQSLGKLNKIKER